jgi:hypothetical protein
VELERDGLKETQGGDGSIDGDDDGEGEGERVAKM